VAKTCANPAYLMKYPNGDDSIMARVKPDNLPDEYILVVDSMGNQYWDNPYGGERDICFVVTVNNQTKME